jgi:hypothetical protein
MFELYIYYQVSDADAPRLLALVRDMQAAMAATHGVGTGLKRRPESEGGLQTWMEIYTGAGPALSIALDDAATAAGVAGLVTGRRHTEVFTEMPPCA